MKLRLQILAPAQIRSRAPADRLARDVQVLPVMDYHPSAPRAGCGHETAKGLPSMHLLSPPPVIRLCYRLQPAFAYNVDMSSLWERFHKHVTFIMSEYLPNPARQVSERRLGK